MTIKNFKFNDESISMLDLALGLDENLGSVGLRVEVLEDISVKMKNLQENMDQSVYNGTEKITFANHHREVRVLAELMYYTMNELTKNYEETSVVSESITDKAKAEHNDSAK